MGPSPGDKDSDADEYRDWTHDLSALQELGENILEEWRTENPQSPRDYPTVRWLTDNGYAHLRWILREKHDMGIPEFFAMFTSAGGSESYEWSIDDIATIERIRAYLDDNVACRDWRASTKRTQRARINEVFRRFRQEYGSDKIIAIANDPDLKTEVYDSFKTVVQNLREDLCSDDSVNQYMRAAHRFLEWLDRSGRIKYDPMGDLEDEFSLDWSQEPTALSDEQVGRLWDAAETEEEQMLVIGYCVWGVRTRELPAVHVDQLDLDGEPKIEFCKEDRKNGSGEVTLMFGIAALASLLDKRARRPGWNGYLWPSNDETRSYLSPKRMREKFKELSRKADVTIDGDPATPKHGRTFYYNLLASAEADILEMCERIAEEQGASDPASVRKYYLTDEQIERYRRIFFRYRIRQILPDSAYNGSGTIEFDSSIDDFDC